MDGLRRLFRPTYAGANMGHPYSSRSPLRLFPLMAPLTSLDLWQGRVQKAAMLLLSATCKVKHAMLV